MENKVLLVSEELKGVRLDKAISLLDASITRTKAENLIDEGLVFVNKKKEKCSYKVEVNDEILIINVIDESNEIKKENIPLDIVYEDNDVIIINKPEGMVVHPANGHYSGTLVNALLYHFENNLSKIGGESRPGIVHRLDKDTSGLIMVAKNDNAHLKLSAQLKDKSAYRRYLALVTGELPYDSGSIVAPIGRNNSDRKKMMVVREGKDATTHFKVLERFNGYTLIECVLETGRTHQIRVHFHTVKFPLVGDTIYGPKKVAYPHLMLHAETLSFIHPSTNLRITKSVEPPEYFKECLNNLRTTGKLNKEN